MAHSHLFGQLQRALAQTQHEDTVGTRPTTHLQSTHLSAMHPSGVGGVGSTPGSRWSRFFAPESAQRGGGGQQRRIVIVGAGLSGLTAAHQLHQAGLDATIYEAAERVGGRVWSERNAFGTGLVIEKGAEFIDSRHTTLLKLVKELGLELIDLYQCADPAAERYFFGGRVYTCAQAAALLEPLRAVIADDVAQLTGNVTYRTPNGGTALDHLSIADWLTTRIGPRGMWLRDLLELAYVIEFGVEAELQSSLNLLYLLGGSSTPSTFSLFGASDERFKVVGGNSQIAERLAAQLPAGTLKPGHFLLAVREKQPGGPYTLTFQHGQQVVDVAADQVIMTLPFSLLRECDLSGVTLSPVKRQAIATLGYGNNSKLIMPFKRRVWALHGMNGTTYADTGYQVSWDTSRGQRGAAGVLVNMLGGDPAQRLADCTPQAAAQVLLRGMEPLVPGLQAAWRGEALCAYWPDIALAKVSHSCWLVGQYTSIAGSEGEPEGNLFFAGEHTSYTAQGYMNGAVESGLRAAFEVAATTRQLAGVGTN